MQCSLHDVAGMTESEDVTVTAQTTAGAGAGQGVGTDQGQGLGTVARRVVCPLVSRHIDFLGDPPCFISYICTLTHRKSSLSPFTHTY